MTNEKENLDDCTHTAPKGKFKAMNPQTKPNYEELKLKKRMNKEKTKISPDFIGDNPNTMRVGTICPKPKSKELQSEEDLK